MFPLPAHVVDPPRCSKYSAHAQRTPRSQGIRGQLSSRQLIERLTPPTPNPRSPARPLPAGNG